MMWKLLAMMGAMFDWGANTEWGPDGKPKFCGKLDCPKFQVMNETDMFQLRCYPELHWVATDGDRSGTWDDQKKPFMRLFRYISGKNSAEEKIAMTAPVLMQHSMKKDMVSSKYTMSFYITSDSAPKPEDPQVKLMTTPKTCYYVHSFGGYAMTKQYTRKVKALMAELDKEGISFDRSSMWATGYDSPWKFWNRHNEVWLRA